MTHPDIVDYDEPWEAVLTHPVIFFRTPDVKINFPEESTSIQPGTVVKIVAHHTMRETLIFEHPKNGKRHSVRQNRVMSVQDWAMRQLVQ